MSVENLDPQEKIDQENQKEFEQELGDELDNLTPDEKKNFGEMIQGVSYDKTFSKDDNIRLAFQINLHNKLENSFANIQNTDEYKEVQSLMREASHGGDLKEILDVYQKAKDIIDTRDGGSAKGTEINQRMDQSSQDQEKAEQKNKTDFLDKLQKLREASFKKMEEKSQEAGKITAENTINQQIENAPQLAALEINLASPSSRAPSGTDASV